MFGFARTVELVPLSTCETIFHRSSPLLFLESLAIALFVQAYFFVTPHPPNASFTINVVHERAVAEES